ncbi:MAG: hypothetical protein R2818_01905 [Flavobacteriales bacterium]
MHPSERQVALAIFKEWGVELEDELVGSPLLERFDELTKVCRFSAVWVWLAL